MKIKSFIKIVAILMSMLFISCSQADKPIAYDNLVGKYVKNLGGVRIYKDRNDGKFYLQSYIDNYRSSQEIAFKLNPKNTSEVLVYAVDMFGNASEYLATIKDHKRYIETHSEFIKYDPKDLKVESQKPYVESAERKAALDRYRAIIEANK